MGLKGKKVLISGASIAGPALAYWLGRHGFEVTVVELAPSLREGGQAVDFRGDTHLTVLERMGVLDDLRRLRTGGSPMVFVDEQGKTGLRLPADFAGGDIEVLRGDLARVLYEHSLPYADYVFGDSISELRQDADGVHVRFRSGGARTFDLVIGADGLHSNVRRLAFGPEEQYVSHLGYYAATWSLPNYPGLGFGEGSVGVNVPGRYASVGTDNRNPETARAFCVFAADRLTYDRHDQEQQKAIIAEAFAGVGWDVPRLLATLNDADELYFDSISRADVPNWSNGRVALVGDAACGATIGGMGTGTGIVAAYVLAGELAAADGDHATAFARYEHVLREYAQGCQKGGDRTGKFLAPGKLGIRIRNWMLSRPRILNWMLEEGKKATSLDLPDYRLPRPAQPSKSVPLLTASQL
ncbi:2-polyprenyl-6-methoxyphenol hydroxylase-like FAD-dependent oxidoreductase [Streptomyces olivoverticillatus]|uniref:2-polyprenyl-6-methoxyphenol hydroxylase-like FAD-dependent oxidoreductase n=1 Tax=Streptomyces olivoverticillatus TaxID=66427 RepID=A0A7W7LK57_9ACTN|nr:FAD-dependent monooxygenase [Streptomyces olivoverticillatus]MBB4891743.1 2-polyprenyl-6-methoxyphenol hydroxylase-like FAD-dependent oxidoreductase [Streptomyces olivoverticillatus]